MIRTNESMHCTCLDQARCPNGSDYCERVNHLSGRKNCRTVGKVKPIDWEKLETDLVMNQALYEIGYRASKVMFDEIAEVRKGKARIEILLAEDPRQQQVSKKAGAKNDPQRIKELRIMSDIVRLVELAHQRPARKRKDMSYVREHEYQTKAVQYEERKQALRERLGIDPDKVVPSPRAWEPIPNRHREPHHAIWIRHADKPKPEPTIESVKDALNRL